MFVHCFSLSTLVLSFQFSCAPLLLSNNPR
nr:MAG TPA: hypothetical protein [Caudoviricetes sp.]DAN63016.1 MAG TPA: hypothetical protein [Caudoviricetes sp.]DAP53425.1 MAG TPA: hypothetical protein [Caudoviricetes sp.]DAU05060.1 MAG TPA: hypothetical protein [Caudoviricetes sp.]